VVYSISNCLDNLQFQTFNKTANLQPRKDFRIIDDFMNVEEIDGFY